MNKKELVKSVATKTEETQVLSEKFVEAFLQTVEEALGRGEEVRLVGFGSWEIKERKARDGHNPKNPEEKIHIPAKRVPVFKCGKLLKDAVLGVVKE